MRRAEDKASESGASRRCGGWNCRSATAPVRTVSRRDVLCRIGHSGLILASITVVGCSRSATSRTPLVGFLATGTREGRAFLIDGFQRGMRDLGYVEGQNVATEY